MTNYKRFDETAWADFGKALLQEKGSEEQIKFIEKCRSGKEKFLSYIHEKLPQENSVIGDEPIKFSLPSGSKLSEKEFINLQSEHEDSIYKTFKCVEDEMLFKCGFWGYVIYNMLDDGCIAPSYLAAEKNETGVMRIDKAIRSKNGKEIDEVVRRILRSMCNPDPRGKRIIFNDFYLGKSYWRWHWAEKMAQHLSELNPDQIRKTLDAGFYSTFAAQMHTGRSYIGSENVLGGLLLYLQKDREIIGEELGKIIKKISYLSAWKAIEMQSPDENYQDIKNLPA